MDKVAETMRILEKLGWTCHHQGRSLRFTEGGRLHTFSGALLLTRTADVPNETIQMPILPMELESRESEYPTRHADIAGCVAFPEDDDLRTAFFNVYVSKGYAISRVAKAIDAAAFKLWTKYKGKIQLVFDGDWNPYNCLENISGSTAGENVRDFKPPRLFDMDTIAKEFDCVNQSTNYNALGGQLDQCICSCLCCEKHNEPGRRNRTDYERSLHSASLRKIYPTVKIDGFIYWEPFPSWIIGDKRKGI